MSLFRVQNLTRPLPRPLSVRRCASFLCRLRGLMFHPPLPVEKGLWLVGERESRLDSSIHMLFMRTDLAVVWLDGEGVVVDVCLARRWHPAYFPARPAREVLELSPARLGDFSVGDRLVFQKISER